ncbi:ethanolamine utilization protein EutP [Serratia fonticola]|jgi:ethanolamine utilization protein EutP|uniref:Ethanolamine utilization protein EutP n=1 Tax=Serratia fonticola TaxID=47917 RepID=A0A542BNF5_SERFO|nr:EutP/PduV family microcompartment system protein [Serratia fonticola]TQI80121.1 ethanolamine utilization protein EutP [Serratia fonticola]TQI97852.1 ethanolamine utilization protein EutP [Serratia fonticola]TVZ72350.1 ethanolamine utilization protein EutP [Serratia fonticola]
MKRIMLIGPSQCGKTSLIQRLQGETLHYHKTQAIVWQDCAIDTPGEYLENRCLYSALLASACEADVVGLVQNVDAEQSGFAPMFAQVFTQPVIGIISKADALTRSNQLAWATERLCQAGVQQVFITSAQTGAGMEDLARFLNHDGESHVR